MGVKPASGTLDGSPSPSKRARVDSERGFGGWMQDSPAYARDEDFWYTDGTVVIRLKETMFKLHASRLSLHCTYFADLFAAKGSDAQQETFDGLAVFDAPADVPLESFKDLLRALETPLYVTSIPNYAVPRITHHCVN